MKLLLGISFVVLLALLGCTTASSAPTATSMVHIGNYDLETTNQLVLAASAANIQFELSAPYGEGCTQAADCTWDENDRAFLIEAGKEQAFWESWQALYCTTDSTDLWCSPDEN